MELFKLFGTILIDNSKATKELYETEKKSKELADAMADVGEKFTMIGGIAAAAGAAIFTAIGVKSVMAADELQQSLNKLQAQTGATDADMVKFKDSIMALFEAGAGQSMEDIAQAMSEVARTTGLSGEQLEKTTKNALLLRDTFDMGVNESARTANSLIKNFGITAEQAYTLMAQGAQQGANKNGDLLDVLNEYSVQFKSLGFSAEQFTGVLIDGAKNGSFSIDKVGDAMKEFNIVSKDGSKTTAAAFEGLGLNAAEMTRAFATGGDTAQKAFTTVMQKLAGIEDPVKKNAIGVGLFRTQFEDLETKAIEALGNIQTQTDKSADTLDKINDAKLKSFGAQLMKLGRQIQVDFFIPIGEKLIPKLKELGTWFDSNKEKIQNGLSVAVDGIVGTLNVFISVIKVLINNMNILLPVIIGVTAAIVAQSVVGMITSLYNAWKIATTTMTTAQWLLNAAMNANPFGLIATVIGVVIGAIALLIANWDTVKSVTLSVWGAITGFFEASVEKIKGFFSSMADGIKSAFDSLVGFVKVPLNLIIDGLNFFIKGYESMLNSVIGAINSIPDIQAPDWLGGGEFGIPDLKPVKFGAIPKLAEGGTITKPGMVMVGERGPELLNLPSAASVIPLEKAQQPITITINNPTIMNDRDAEKFGDLLVRFLKSKGIQPRGI